MAICLSSRSPVPTPESVDHAVDAGDCRVGLRPTAAIDHSRSICCPGDDGSRGQRGRLVICICLYRNRPLRTRSAIVRRGVVSVTVPLTGVSVFTNYIRWSDNQSLGSLFSADGGDQTLTTVDLNSGSPSGQVFISITGTDNRFTPAFEASGTIIFEASDGETLEVMIADADMSEPYMWVPLTSVLEVVAFVNHIRTLTDQSGTLTLRGEGVAVTDHTVNAGDASLGLLRFHNPRSRTSL